MSELPRFLSITCSGRTRTGLFLIGSLLLTCATVAAAADAADPASTQRILDLLEARVVADPADASRWRLLAKARLKAGDSTGGRKALDQAVQLDPLDAASRHDLGQLLLDTGDASAAAEHLSAAVQIAPDSHYAEQARLALEQIPQSRKPAEVVQASYEIREFDGSDRLSREKERVELPNSPAVSPFSLRLESGLLYNSNVALSPTSRSLAPGSRESLQWYLSPDLEYRFIDGDNWTAGVTLLGNLTLNEGSFRELNLQSYQPGLFIERAITLAMVVLAPRAQFDSTIDLFDGDLFAQRQTVTTSLAAYWNNGDLSLLYYSVDWTDFASDGLLPSQTSSDGWTHSTGISHSHVLDRRFLRSIGGGVDLQLVNAEGSDLSYHSVSLYLDAEVPVVPTVDLLLQGGWGFRDYPDFSLTPSRNENLWTGEVRLRKRLSEQMSVAAVLTWNQFASRNDFFDAERVVGGVVLRYER